MAPGWNADRFVEQDAWLNGDRERVREHPSAEHQAVRDGAIYPWAEVAVGGGERAPAYVAS